jgi:hypothetical protein
MSSSRWREITNALTEPKSSSGRVTAKPEVILN